MGRSEKDSILVQQIEAECRKIAEKIANWNCESVEKLRQLVTDMINACEDLGLLTNSDFDVRKFVKTIPSIDMPETWFLENKALAIDKNGYVLFENGKIELFTGEWPKD